MPRIDLDAARAARAEARSKAGIEEIIVVLAGQEYALVDELPLEFGEMLSQDRLSDALRLLLKDDAQVPHFLSARPSIRDLEELAEGYAVGSLGKYSASSTPSKKTTNGSRRTSKGSTA